MPSPRRFPKIVLPKRDDICYATQNRQDAVKELAVEADLVLVVGAPASSNSNRSGGSRFAARRPVLSDPERRRRRIPSAGSTAVECVGVTAGASTPDVLVQGVLSNDLR